MTSPEIVLSFNEISFFFTRAAVGVGVPFGLAEDFGRTSIWIGGAGLDPAKVTSPVLQALDDGLSSLGASLTESAGETVVVAFSGKQLSALQAGSTVCDWISAKTEVSKKNHHIVAKNVDHPFLIAAALASFNYAGWEICWQGLEGSICKVMICVNGSWKTSWSGSKIPSQSSSSDVMIIPAGSMLSSTENWVKQIVYSEKNKTRMLESGVPVYESWPVIRRFFSRCLVPSTDQSRMTGAGAGLVDDD